MVWPNEEEDTHANFRLPHQNPIPGLAATPHWDCSIGGALIMPLRQIQNDVSTNSHDLKNVRALAG